MISLKNLIIILLLSTIISCASIYRSPDETRSKPPKSKYTSSRSTKEVAMCIANKWENLYGVGVPVNMRPTEYGYTLMVIDTGSGHTQFLADIKNEETGSSTFFYENVIGSARLFDEAVMKCQSENQ